MSDEPGWYIKWAGRHCKAFALRDKDLYTLLAWRSVFERLYTFSELTAATESMIASDTIPPFADRHRGIIIALIGGLHPERLIVVAGHPEHTMDTILAIYRRAVRRHGVKLVVIGYLQLIEHGGHRT